VCPLHIKGDNITGKMKTQMESQLHNTHMQKYLIEREVWIETQFKEIDWSNYDMAVKCMGVVKTNIRTQSVSQHVVHRSETHITLPKSTPMMYGWGVKGRVTAHYVMQIPGRITAQSRLMEKGKELCGNLAATERFMDNSKKGLQFYIDHPL
jgi:hypothetical protein